MNQEDFVEKELLTAMKEKRQSVSDIVNEAIIQEGSGLNPSMNAVLRHGRLIDLSEEALTVLDRNAEMHALMYESAIIPRVPEMLRALLGNKSLTFNMQEGCVLDAEDLRKILFKEHYEPKNHMIDKTGGSLFVDAETENALKGPDPLPVVNYQSSQETETRFYLDLKHGALMSLRPKDVGRLSRKQRVERDEAIQKGYLFELYNFIEEVVTDPNPYWRDEIRKQYLSKYPDKVTDILVGDNLGIRVTIMDREKALRTQNRILSNKRRLNTSGFAVLEERIEDHRYRTVNLRPGGIHLTAVEKGLHLPVEIQVLDQMDLILDLVGPHSHWRYTQRGKKRDSRYSD